MIKNDFDYVDFDYVILFLFIGTWLLASAIMILSFNLLGISISIVVNNILIALIVGFVGTLLWVLLMYFSMSVIEKFYKIKWQYVVK